MAEHIDREIEAIKAVLIALEPLSPEVRTNVLQYVLRRLQIALVPEQQTEASRTPAPRVDATLGAAGATATTEQQTTPTHIKDLKENKKPRSANEMAALVAFYLANIAPSVERKERITTKDIETHFKIAKFPLPEKPQFTLGNAKAAGYLDAVGNSEYKLNAVGYNLVVHSMPRGTGGNATPRRKPAKKSRPPAKKKAKAPAKKK
ncbi:MAG: hypothetical protein ACE5H7_16265 [Acidiferrobacterales bacterium]